MFDFFGCIQNFSFASWLKRTFQTKQQKRYERFFSRRQLRRVRPEVEVLEDRLNLSPVINLTTTLVTDVAQSAVALDNSLTVTDTTSSIIEGANVKIAVNYQSSEDALSYNGSLPRGVTANFDSATGKLSFIGPASVDAYQSLLQTVTFADSNASPNFSPRSVTFTVVDDQYDTDTAGMSVNVMANQTTTFGSLNPVTYGVSPITLSATASSGLPVSFSVVSGPGTVSGNTLTVTGAGVILVEADQAGNVDYLAAPAVQQHLVVDKATLTVTGITASNKVYDGGSSAVINTSADGLTGVIGLDDVSLISTGAVGAFASSDVANGITVRVSGLTLGGAQASDYQLPTPQFTTTANITPALLTVFGITAKNKVYDGSRTAVLVTSGDGVNGVIGEDDVSLVDSGATGKFASDDAANGIVVSVSGLTLGGAQAGDYQLPFPQETTTADITPATLTVTGITASDKVYDGGATATLDTTGAAITGVIGQDAVSLVATSAVGTFASQDAANGITVNVSGLILSGAQAGDYQLPIPQETTTANITPAMLTVSGITANNKVYDGNTTASLTTTGEILSGVIGLDDVSLVASGAVGTLASKDVANGIMVTISGLALSGAQAGDYQLTTPQQTTTANITPATLTASIIGDPIKTYDGNTSAALTPANFALYGLVGGESFTITQTAGTYNSQDVTAATNVSASLAGSDFTAGPGTLASDYTLPTGATGAAAITPATLTVYGITASDKVYDGGTSASLTTTGAGIVGVIGLDDVLLDSSGAVGTFASKDVANGIAVTVSGLSLSGAQAGDYQLPSPQLTTTANITPATLTASIIGNPSKAYDGNTGATLSPINFALSGLIGSDTFTVIQSSGTYNSPDVATAATVTVSLAGSDFVAGFGTLASDYTFPTSASGPADITPATLTVYGITAGNKVYDGATTAVLNTTGANLSGVIGLDDVSLMASGAVGTFAGQDVASGITVTISGLTLSGAQAGDYQLPTPQQTTTANITPATLTVSGITAADKVYDGGAAAILNTSGENLTGVIGLDNVTLVSNNAIGTFATTDVANGITVTISGLTLGGAQASDYQLPTPQLTTTANITPATLAVTGITANSKIYDGATSATLNTTAAGLLGVIGLDAVSLVTSGAVGTFASQDAAHGITVAVSGLTLSGAQAGDYQLPAPQLTTTADITPVTLVVSGITARDKVYDGGATATLDTTTAGITGVIGLDEVTLVASSAVGTFASQDVANGITVTVSGMTLSGAQAGDYQLPTPQQTTTANITPATLTVSGIMANNKVYDGSTTATLNMAGENLTGVIGLDDVTLIGSGAVGTFASQDVANGITVIVSGLTLSGAQASDYQLPTPQETTTANITPATLTVSGLTASNKVYDGGNTAALGTAGAGITGVIGLDDVSLVFTGAVGTFASADVANGITVAISGLTLTGAQAGDYQLPTPQQTTTANITPATLSVGGITASNKVYDGGTAATLSTAGASLAGVIGLDDVSLDSSGAVGTFASKDVANGIAVTITGLILDGAQAGDYQLPTPQATTTADITPALLTASIVGNPSKTYDGNTSAALTSANFLLSGLVGSERFTVTQTSGAYDSQDVTAATTVTASLASSDFTAGPGTLASDYTLPTSASGAAHITPATLTVSGITASDKVYDGGRTAALSMTGAGLTGVIGLDDVSLDSSGAVGTFASKDVANGITVTVSGLTLSGAQAGDYLLLTPQQTTTANITPAPLTVTGITASNKVYDGGAIAAVNTAGASINGVIGLDDVTLDSSSAVGTFATKDVANGITVTIAGLALSGAQAGDYQLPLPQATTTANITPATLAVTGITASNKVYDGGFAATLNSTAASINGVIGLDDVTLDSSGAVGTFASQDVAHGIAVTISGLSLGGAQAGDYQLPTPQETTTANITPATLTVSGITASNKVYDGDTTAALSAAGSSITGVIGLDAVTLATSGAVGTFASQDVANGITVTISGLTLSGAQAGDYQLPTPQETTTANITPATLSVAGVTARNKVYDGNTSATLNTTGASLTGIIGLDDVTLVSSGASGVFASRDVANGIAVTVSGLALGGAQAGDYQLPTPQETTTANITPATLTVSGITANNKVYDGGFAAMLNTVGAGIVGLIGLDDVALVSSGAIGTFVSKDVANGIAVAVSGLTLSGAQAGDYLLPVPQEITAANITPATLTVTGITAGNKVYDGGASAALNSSGAGITGVVGLDDVTLVCTGAVGAFASKDVANGITVTVSGLTLAGAQAGDYQLPALQFATTANITPATLTVTGITASNKVYDGGATATLTTMGDGIVGVIGLDDVSLVSSGAVGAFASNDVASGITVTISGLTLGGAQAGDYQLPTPQDTTTANITPATLDVSGILANNKVYDGGTAATLDFSSAVLGGVIGSDQVSLSTNAYAANFASPNAANGIAVTVGGLGLNGAQAFDYTLSQPTGLTANITKASQAITFAPLTAVSYGTHSVTLDATSSSGLPVTFSVISGPGSVSGATLTLAGPGVILVQADQPGNGNYLAAPAVQQVQLVNRADDTITFNPLGSVTFGVGTVSLSASSTNSADVNDPVIFTVLAGPGFTSGNNGSTLNVTGGGSILIEATQAADSNYDAATPVMQTLTVDPAGQSITFTGPVSPVAYGVGPIALSASADSGLPIAFSVVSGPGFLSGSTLTVTGAGAIVIEADQAGNANFNAAVAVQQTLVVNPASLTVTASNESATYGQSDPTLAFTYSGLVNGDLAANFTGNLARSAGANVGIYPITQDTLTATGNYTIGAFNAGTFTINPAPLSVTASNESTIFGQADPTLAFTYAGLVNGDSTAQFTGNLARGAGATVGTYAITQNTLAATGNYAIGAFNAGTFTIAPASDAIVFGPLNPVTFGVGTVTLNATGGGSSSPVVFTVLSGPGSVSGATLNVSGAGAIVIQATQAGDVDFNPATPVIRTLTVNPASQAITFTGPARPATYGVGPITLNASADSGLPVVFSVVSGPGFLNGNSLTVTGAGAIVIQADQAGNANFNAAPAVQRTLLVNQASLTVTASNENATYGQSDPPLAFTYTGLVNGDLAANFTGNLARTAGSNVGIYSITQNTLTASGNYTIGAFNAGTFTITPARDTIAFGPLNPVTFGIGMVTLNATGSGSSSPVVFTVLSGPGSVNGATLTVSGAGAIVIQATQAGDIDYSAATPVIQTLAVEPAGQSIAFNGPASPVTYGVGPITLSASADSGLPVAFSVVSGPGFLSGSTLTVTGAGAIVIEADQAGNANFNAAPAVQQTLVVNRSNQTITLAPLTSPVTFGVSPLTLGATTVSGLPVTFSVLSGPGAISGNQLTVMGAGSIVVQADQPGNANYAAAPSIQETLLVNKANDAINFGALGSITFGANPITLSAAGASSSPIDFTVISGPGSVIGDTLTVDGAGAIVVEAGQAGDNNYLAAAPVDQTLSVNKADDAITFGPLSPVTFGVAPLTLSATGSGSSSPVVFTVLAGPGRLSGNTLTVDGGGSILIEATQAGDANFNAAIPVFQTLTVSPASQRITFTGPNGPATFGVAPITLSASADSGLPVAFAVLSGPGVINGNSLTVTGAGAIVIQANQPGSSNYAAAPAVQETLVVNQADQTITFGSLSPVNFSANPIALTAMTSSGLAVAYSVLSGPGTINGNVLTLTGIGSIVIQASQAGDANYHGATPVRQTLVVAKGIQAITFGALSPTTFSVNPITLSATASSGLPIAYVVMSGPGKVSGSTLTVTGVGPIVIQANQAGNADYNAAPAVQQTLVVSKATQTVTFGTLTPVTYGTNPITLTAASSSGLPIAYTVVSGPGTISGNKLIVRGAGSIVVQATQAGNADYLAATPIRQTLTVNRIVLTLTGVTAVSKAYTGATNATLNFTHYVLNGLLSKDRGGVLLKARDYAAHFASANVGNAIPVAVTGLALQGARSSNYTLAQPANLTANITPASQTIKFNQPAAAIYSTSSFSIPVTLSAAASSGLPVAFTVLATSTTGAITVASTRITGATVNHGITTAVLTIDGTVTGTSPTASIVIEANQGGDANHHAAAPVKVTVTLR